jgi:hypothetical protein
MRYTKEQRALIKSNVERDVKWRWGWVVDIEIEPSGDFHWRMVEGLPRYDLYPGMTPQEADDAVIAEITTIFQMYMPGARVTDYVQSGREHIVR